MIQHRLIVTRIVSVSSSSVSFKSRLLEMRGFKETGSVKSFQLFQIILQYCFNMPRYLMDMVRLRTSAKDVCGTYRLEIPTANTTTYGLPLL